MLATWAYPINHSASSTAPPSLGGTTQRGDVLTRLKNSDPCAEQRLGKVLWQPKWCFFVGKFWQPTGIWNKKLISFETGWTCSLSFHGWNTWSNGGATKEHLDHLFRSQQHWHQQRSHQILENPQARFIGAPTDCGGVIQQTWGSILNVAILLMAKIWTSFGWWFIYIYLTIYRVLYIPGAAFEPLIIYNICVACASTNTIRHLTVFVHSGRDDIVWTRKPWCDYSTWHPTVKQPFHDQLKQVLVEPVMSIIYTYVQTKICVQIYHCTYTKIIFTLIINHVSNTLCLYTMQIKNGCFQKL